MSQLLFRTFDSPLGTLIGVAVIADAERGICMLEFSDRRALPRERRDLERHFETDITPEQGASHCDLLDELERQCSAYFNDPAHAWDLPLITPGTPFQRRVWDELRRIRVGETCSYGELAERVGSSGGARAVGAANGANRIGIIIPCHRVIEASGALRGYGGGLKRKKWLLEHEAAIHASLFVR